MTAVATTRRVLIVEPDLWAHHAFWLTLIIQSYQEAGWETHVLTNSTDPQFIEQAGLRGLNLANVRFYQTTSQDDRLLLGQAAEIVSAIGAETVFFAYLDRFWDELLAQVKSSPLKGKISGIWFHPYALDAICRWLPPLDKRWSLRGRIHRFLRSMQAGRTLQTLFFLFEDARAQLLSINATLRAGILPDPYEREPRLSQKDAQEYLNVPTNRTVFLHLGSPEKRKGLPDVIEAFIRLTKERKAWARPPLLLRVGPNSRLKASDRIKLDQLSASGNAQVVDDFVPSRDLMEYFGAADWVLIPYRKFRFSSGILANALGGRRPVIVSDYGMSGRTVRTEHIGRVYCHASIPALHLTLTSALGETAGSIYYDKLLQAHHKRNPTHFIEALKRGLNYHL